VPPEQTALTIQQNRFVADIALIQALGGGWQSSDLPAKTAIRIPDVIEP